MKILWLTNLPSPYRVDFFNELGKKCELTVLFEKNKSTERDKSWGKYNFISFKGIILNGINYSTDKAFSPNILWYIKKKKYDYIIVSNIATLTGIFAIEYMKLRKIDYCIETDGGFAKNGKGLKEKYKKHLIKNANLYFSTSKENDKYFIKYGAESNKIIRYPFTSIKKSDILKECISYNEKEKIKKQLGIYEGKVILSVGQFIYRKGYDILIESIKNIDKSIGIYIIGGKPTEEYIFLKNKYELKNLHFIDFKSKDNLNDYYKISDLFVFPTREDIWGLVINEAMSKGLPIITTNKCIAGLELVEDSKNGFIIESENIGELEEKINILLKDTRLRDQIANNNIEKIKKYTIENMAEEHIQILKG